MLYMVTPHSRTRIGHPLRVNAMSLNLSERNSTATATLNDLEDIRERDLHTQWFFDDSEPGADIVWRERSVSVSKRDQTPTLQLEHVVNTLRDTVLFQEVTPAKITGVDNATTCTARQALNWLMTQQETADWVLGFLDSSYDAAKYTQEYSFQGTETIFDAIETVCGTLDDCRWELDTTVHPFRLNIVRDRDTDSIATKLRASRNIRSMTVTKDKTGMFTRFYPIGENDLHYSDPNNTNRKYVQRNTDLYGIIEKTATDESLKTNEALKEWADAQLLKYAQPVLTINIDGVDLSQATGESIDAMHLGRPCQVILYEDGETYLARIIELNYQDKIKNPEGVRITLSNKRDDVTKLIANDRKTANKGARVQARKNKQTNSVLLDTVKDVKITGPVKNVYTLKFLLVRGNKDTETDWKSGGTFSRAVTDWEVTAAKGVIKVTAKPQEDYKNVHVKQGDMTRKGTTYTGQVQYSKDDGATWFNTGAAISVDASEITKLVTLKDPVWQTAPSSSITGNSNKVTVETDGRDPALSKSVQLYMNAGDWGTGSRAGQRYIYTTVTDSSAANRVMRINVDAHLLGPSWATAPSSSITGNSNTVTVSSVTGESKAVVLYMTRGDWSTGKRYIYANQGDSTAANRVMRIEVDASLLDPVWTNEPSASITGNSNTVTVSSLTGQSKSISLYMSRGDWSGGTRYVYVHQSDSTDANRVARIEVDARLLTPVWTNTPSASITGNSNTVTVSSMTGESVAINLYMTRGSWSGGSRYIYVNQGDSTDANRVARIDVDASLNTPTWARSPSSSITGNSNTLTVSSQTGESISKTLYLNRGSWSGGSRYVYICDGDTADTSRVARISINASLDDPVWSTTPDADITVNSNTVTVESATGQSKSVDLYMNAGSWSSGSKYVYTCHTDSADEHRVARYEVTIPNPTNLSSITTYGDTPPSGGHSFGQVSKSGLTAGKYMSMTARFGGKTFTFYFQVIA